MYVYITMGLHRKAGFHWRKKGFTVFAEKFGKPLVLETRVPAGLSDLILGERLRPRR